MPRFFTIEQAEQLLPEVEAAIRDAISLKSQYQDADDAYHGFQQRIMLMGGVVVDRSQLLELKSRRDSNAVGLKESIEKIQEFGCLVKDLDIGLIDFPTVFDGQEVCLCWKLGETGIRFWHGIQEGFRGRKPIDQAFLDQHHGERPN